MCDGVHISFSLQVGWLHRIGQAARCCTREKQVSSRPLPLTMQHTLQLSAHSLSTDFLCQS